jgi:hypothetical protein
MLAAFGYSRVGRSFSIIRKCKQSNNTEEAFGWQRMMSLLQKHNKKNLSLDEVWKVKGRNQFISRKCYSTTTTAIPGIKYFYMHYK